MCLGKLTQPNPGPPIDPHNAVGSEAGWMGEEEESCRRNQCGNGRCHHHTAERREREDSNYERQQLEREREFEALGSWDGGGEPLERGRKGKKKCSKCLLLACLVWCGVEEEGEPSWLAGSLHNATTVLYCAVLCKGKRVGGLLKNPAAQHIMATSTLPYFTMTTLMWRMLQTQNYIAVLIAYGF